MRTKPFIYRDDDYGLFDKVIKAPNKALSVVSLNQLNNYLLAVSHINGSIDDTYKISIVYDNLCFLFNEPKNRSRYAVIKLMTGYFAFQERVDSKFYKNQKATIKLNNIDTSRRTISKLDWFSFFINGKTSINGLTVNNRKRSLIVVSMNDVKIFIKMFLWYFNNKNSFSKCPLLNHFNFVHRYRVVSEYLQNNFNEYKIELSNNLVLSGGCWGNNFITKINYTEFIQLIKATFNGDSPSYSWLYQIYKKRAEELDEICNIKERNYSYVDYMFVIDKIKESDRLSNRLIPDPSKLIRIEPVEI